MEEVQSQSRAKSKRKNFGKQDLTPNAPPFKEFQSHSCHHTSEVSIFVLELLQMFFNWKNYLKTLTLLTDQLIDTVKQEGIISRKYIYFILCLIVKL